MILNGQYVDLLPKVINANGYLDKGNMMLPKLQVLTICCTALKGACCSSQLLIKEEHPFAASLLLKGWSMLFQKVFALKLLWYWDFSCFRSYLVLSIMFVARPACCFKQLVVTASTAWYLVKFATASFLSCCLGHMICS